MANCLDERFENAFHYYNIEVNNYSILNSTNMLEHFNFEIRGREKVIGIFPN